MRANYRAAGRKAPAQRYFFFVGAFFTGAFFEPVPVFFTGALVVEVAACGVATPLISINSTSKLNTALGGMSPPAPRSPYPRGDGM
jgi:hypothetical protein